MLEDENRILILQEYIRETQEFFLKQNKGELYKHILELVERPLIKMVLEKTRGNQKKTAKILGINRNTLHTKIKKLDINVSDFKK